MAEAIARPRPAVHERTLSQRIVRFLGKTPVHIALAIIALVWLAPTVGLLVTSFRPRTDIQSTGWWDAIFQFRFTLDNYVQVLGSQGMGQAFLNTVMISVPSTLIPLVVCS